MRVHHTVVLIGLLLAGCGGVTEPVGGSPTQSVSPPRDAPPAEEVDTRPPDDGAAAGSCLADDPDCTDESTGGRDAVQALPLSSEPSGAERLESGVTTGATSAPLTGVHQLDESTLEVTFQAGVCHLVQQVAVTPSDEAVRVEVLVGQDPAVEACTQQIAQWSVHVQLDTPLDGRPVLGLAD